MFQGIQDLGYTVSFSVPHTDYLYYDAVFLCSVFVSLCLSLVLGKMFMLIQVKRIFLRFGVHFQELNDSFLIHPNLGFVYVSFGINFPYVKYRLFLDQYRNLKIISTHATHSSYRARK